MIIIEYERNPMNPIENWRGKEIEFLGSDAKMFYPEEAFEAYCFWIEVKSYGKPITGLADFISQLHPLDDNVLALANELYQAYPDELRVTTTQFPKGVMSIANNSEQEIYLAAEFSNSTFTADYWEEPTTLSTEDYSISVEEFEIMLSK